MTDMFTAFAAERTGTVGPNMKVHLQAHRSGPRHPLRARRQADLRFRLDEDRRRGPAEGHDAARALGQDPRRGGAAGRDLQVDARGRRPLRRASAGTTSRALAGREAARPGRVAAAPRTKPRSASVASASSNAAKSRASSRSSGRPAGPVARTQRRSTGAPALSSASASRSSRIGSSGLCVELARDDARAGRRRAPRAAPPRQAEQLLQVRAAGALRTAGSRRRTPRTPSRR